ncbi:MAG TPA: slipin family protein [Dehalococcoidia bacterium]|jgi:regulator of protease activity HflC (stomatin/prohibitin superfamily)|nr:slipin family protein [Dehalococcoidia bacterium]
MSAWVIYLIVVVALVIMAAAVRIVRQYERGVVLRFGRLAGVREPGFNLIIPFVDRMVKVSLRIVPFVLEPQEVITRDNVTVRVDAVVYFKVIDAVKAVLNVENYRQAIIQLALTTLRSVLGQSELDELLAHRDQINLKLRQIIDKESEEPWGVSATLVEVKDVLLPEAMQRAMARQAEAEREKRAKVIHAQGERQAAETLAEAAEIIQRQPVALQLRYLQTLVEMAGERNSTIIPVTLDIVNALASRVIPGGQRPAEGR